ASRVKVVLSAAGLVLLAGVVTVAAILEMKASRAVTSEPQTRVAAPEPRPPLTRAEEAYVRALWPIHGEVERSSVRMSLAQISYRFFLGMRHATDPDHVLAVSTIVTRQRTLRAALLIGILWGVGHTLTIVVVGAAIILFSVVIPPRLGLTMEMAVALMLVVLGMWNLTGVLQRIREALTS